MPRTTSILSISLPKKELREISRDAKREGYSRSQYIRELIRRNKMRKDLDYLQRKGEIIAARLGIETEEDVERIAG